MKPISCKTCLFMSKYKKFVYEHGKKESMTYIFCAESRAGHTFLRFIGTKRHCDFYKPNLVGLMKDILADN